MSQIITDKRTRPISVTLSIVFAIVTLGYMLPWMIAALRGKSNVWAVFWVNLALGWTLIGWLVAFIMSVSPHRIAGIRN